MTSLSNPSRCQRCATVPLPLFVVPAAFALVLVAPPALATNPVIAATTAAATPAPSKPVARERGFDDVLYARLLVEHTTAVDDLAGTRVDYRGLREDPNWGRLLDSLRRSDPSALATRKQKLAFWINAYNILAMRTVLRDYPLESIRDAGSLFFPVWRHEAGRIGNSTYSLREIEHQILRPMGEPRIHFAIVCASTSCPSLAREPYRAADLERQLESALHRFLTDGGKGVRVRPARNEVRLSRIFDWFEEDFERDGGALPFIARHLAHDARRAERAHARWLAAHAQNVRVDYLDYDWALNELPGRAAIAHVP